MASGDALAEEERALRWLRLVVDTAKEALLHRPLSRADAEQVVAEVRREVLRRFPDKGETFDLIYGSRFGRLIEQRFNGGS